MILLQRWVFCGYIAMCSVYANADEASNSSASTLTVFTAKKIITMEPAMPQASAVAVADGRIVAVGNLTSLQSWIDQRGAKIDHRFADKIIMPGFIDPHVHPSLPAILTQFPFIAPDHWSLPTGEFPGATTPEAYLSQLKKYAALHQNPSIPFITWGYHPLWHGELFKDDLNRLFPNQPVLLWHRSFHEIIGNDAAFKLLGIDQSDVANHENVNWQKGHFFETGTRLLLPKMRFIFSPQRYAQGMKNFINMVHSGGVTTAFDMGIGLLGSPVDETNMIRHAAESSQAPMRIILTPTMLDFVGRGLNPAQALEEVDQWRAASSHRVLFDRRFKIFIDGAIFSGLAQFEFPGYLDGHQGVWMTPEPLLQQWTQAFWDEGYQIHAHTNGDASTARLLDLINRLQKNTPRQDHRFSLEHFAYTTEDQNRQLKAAGAVVSANPYYHFILSDIYSDQWLGADRGEQMVRLGSLERLKVPFAFHSDTPMAPLKPLVLASAAANRITINGNLAAPEERVSLMAAMRAITIDAAWVVGWEDEIGSIRAGKRADFTILEADPFLVGVSKLQDIEIWGTVFEGQPAPLH